MCRGRAGWSTRLLFYGEYLVYDIADFDVAIRFAGGQNNLVIAAGALQLWDDGEWQRFSHPAARSFAWSVSPYYQVVTQTVELAQEPHYRDRRQLLFPRPCRGRARACWIRW